VYKHVQACTSVYGASDLKPTRRKAALGGDDDKCLLVDHRARTLENLISRPLNGAFGRQRGPRSGALDHGCNENMISTMIPAGPDDSKKVESTSARTTIQPPPQPPATTSTRNHKHPQPQAPATSTRNHNHARFFRRTRTGAYPSDVVAGGRAGGDSGGGRGW
jgi:hypothetical protein